MNGQPPNFASSASSITRSHTPHPRRILEFDSRFLNFLSLALTIACLQPWVRAKVVVVPSSVGAALSLYSIFVRPLTRCLASPGKAVKGKSKDRKKDKNKVRNQGTRRR
jgi:hypothetical protein